MFQDLLPIWSKNIKPRNIRLQEALLVQHTGTQNCKHPTLQVVTGSVVHSYNSQLGRTQLTSELPEGDILGKPSIDRGSAVA